MDSAVLALLAHQEGVVARHQLLALGVDDSAIARLVRHRELVRVHRGVYVDRTGPLGHGQRCWAAVLFYWPAALAHRTAASWATRPAAAADGTVHVALDCRRRVSRLPGVVVHRLKDFDAVALTNLSPPRVRIEQAVLDVAATARTERQAVAAIADACQSRRTTPTRLRARLEQLPRQRHRGLLLRILRDVEAGAYSVLERMYLRDVERPHGLPTGVRQRRVAAGAAVWYRDVEYVEHRVLIELDGRLGHSATVDRWADLDRDVAAAVATRMTVRLGYRQVLEPCRVAAAVVVILRARGWRGTARPCGPDCWIPAIHGELHAPGAGKSPLTA